EQPFFQYLAFLVPVSDCAELDAKTLVCWWNHFPGWSHHRPLHRAREISYGAREVSLSEHYLVWVVDQVIVRKGLEKLSCFCFVVVAAPGGVRLTWPIDRRFLSVALPEDRPVLAVPGVVQRPHQLQIPLCVLPFLFGGHLLSLD